MMMIPVIIISLFTGLVSGALSSAFLHSLHFVTDLRMGYPLLSYGLPVFGFIFGLIVMKIPHHINQGIPYILEELDNEKAKVSPWMAPFIFLSSLGSHLFGGSVGREGVGVIMGASSAHLLPKFSDVFQKYRAHLIYAGVAAGFSSIFGTPLAAIVFAFEIHRFKDARRIDLVICTVLASFSALLVPEFLGPVHQTFVVSYTMTTDLIKYVLVAGILSGVGGQLFYWGLKGFSKLISRGVPHLPSKLFVGGLLVSLLANFTHGQKYLGIGSDLLAGSFQQQMSLHDFTMKTLLTVMTIAAGFKGGEVTPLFIMGATLSNSVLSFINLTNFGLSSALGMTGFFGAVTATPLASAIMGGELFGYEVGILCFFVSFIGKLIMWKRTVYRL